MLANNERQQSREVFFKAWRKHQLNESLEPLEKQIVQLIHMHPEYHAVLNNPEKYQDYDFNQEDAEENPFLHLGLHLTILEQVSTNRPKGITAVYRDLVLNFGDAMHAEHHMMEILANLVWEMTQKKKPADDKAYLKQLKKLLKKGCSGHQH